MKVLANRHSETHSVQKIVVYEALYGDYKYFVCPYEMFVSKVDHDKYPDVKQEYRFELIEEQAQVYSFFLLCDLLTYHKKECVIINDIEKG